MEEWAIVFKNKIVKRFRIAEGQCLFIGRGSDADIVIDNMSISRKHCSLEMKNGVYYLADWHSMNGTRVDGQKITSETQIMKSSLIELGKFILKPASMLVDEEDAETAAASGDGQEDFNQTLFVSGIYKSKKEDTEETMKPGKGIRLLTVLEGGASPSKVILRKKGMLKAGKEPSCQLVLSGSMAGKLHFTIDYRQNGFYIAHKGGMLRKTSVNGEKVKDDRKLQPMDVIEAAGAKIRYS